MADGECQASNGPIHHHDQLPWTASRCNRLLRPLISKLARHEQLCPRSRSEQWRSLPRPESSCARQAKPPSDKGTPTFKPKAKLRRKYGGRKCVDGQTNPVSKYNEPVTPSFKVFSPLLRKLGPDCEDAKSYRFRGVWVEDRDTRQKLGATTQNRGTVVEDFQRLLKTTQRDDSRNLERSRSLFAICLGQLPKYMADEEAWRRSQDPDDKSDVYCETYMQLEQYGASNINGWPSLRQVARAHGIELMENALRQRLFRVEEAEKLLAMIHSEGDAVLAARMDLAWLQSQTSETSACSTLGKLSSMRTTCDILATPDRYRRLVQGLSGTQQDECCVASREQRLCELVVGKALPLDALCDHAVRSIWQNALKRLIHPSPPLTAEKLISNLLLCCCGVDPSFIDTLPKARKLRRRELFGFVSDDPPASSLFEDTRKRGTVSEAQAIVTTVCTVALTLTHMAQCSQESYSGLVREHNIAHNIAHQFTHIVRSVSLSIMRAYTSPQLLKACQTSMQTICAANVIVADIVLSLYACSRSEQLNHPHVVEQIRAIERLLSENKSSDKTVGWAIDSIGAPIVQAARHVENSRSGAGFTMIKTVCSYFSNSTKESSGSASAWTRLVALEMSMAFATYFPSAEHTHFAKQLEAQISHVSSTHAPIRTRANQRPANLKWEEGLCEWVAATPFSQVKPSVASSQTSSSSHISHSGSICSSPQSRRTSQSVEDTDATSDSDTGSPCPTKQATLPSMSTLKRTASLASLECDSEDGNEDEDELSAPQPGQRALGSRAGAAKFPCKRAKLPSVAQPAGQAVRRSARLLDGLWIAQ